MPNRLIRDGLLESEAVLSLPIEGRWLYVTILLSADDVGLFEATAFKLARRADMKRETVELLLPMLADADLIRLYPGDGIRTFGFIPRYGQRLQIRRARHPLPTLSLLTGDDDAISKIKHLASKVTVNHGNSPDVTAAQPSEPEPEPEENTSVPDGTGGEPPSKPADASTSTVDTADVIFTYGVPLLVKAGTNEKQARSFLGRMRKLHGDEGLISVLRGCYRAKPMQPLEWIGAALAPKGNVPDHLNPRINKQLALEQRNSATAEAWAAQHGGRP